jgi:hypothetical protein
MSAWISRPRDREVEAAAHAKPPRVLVDREPAPDGFRGVVLPEQANAVRTAAAQALREGARHHHVLAEIGDAEEARIAFEHAVGFHVARRLGQEFHLPAGGVRALLHREPSRVGFGACASSRSSWRRKSRNTLVAWLRGGRAAPDCGGRRLTRRFI